MNLTVTNAIPDFKHARARVSNHIEDLAEIYSPDVNMCMINRTVSGELASFIAQLLRTPIELSLVERITFKSFDFYKLLPQAAHIAGHRAFCADIARLSALYCDLFELKNLGLRIRTLDKAMCPKFHVDYVTCRLVCTYGGVGTEWLEEAEIDRSKLGMGSLGLSDAQSGLYQDTNAIQTMPAFAIGLLKGSQWEGNENHGAVHRSPQLSAETPRRLLLTLDFG